jgi:AhpD family alkylhydroperoxidase
MNYAKISKETIAHLSAGRQSLNESPVAAELRSLIELHVSQINGCDYCSNLHTNEALKLGVSKNKIENLSEFMTSVEFSDSEKEALKWAESLTNLNGNKKIQNTELSKYFSERQMVDITICISLMNAFNRLAMSMREE